MNFNRLQDNIGADGNPVPVALKHLLPGRTAWYYCHQADSGLIIDAGPKELLSRLNPRTRKVTRHLMQMAVEGFALEDITGPDARIPKLIRPVDRNDQPLEHTVLSLGLVTVRGTPEGAFEQWPVIPIVELDEHHDKMQIRFAKPQADQQVFFHV